MMARKERIVGVDLGTTKIAAIVAEVEDEDLKIVGVGSTPSNGLKRGVIVNLEKAIESIEKAVDEASRMAGVKVDSCYAGISGSHIESINAHAMIATARTGGVVTKRDIERVIEQAKAIALPMDREIIHAIPIEYVVDNEKGIKDPVGMSGVKLEAEVHIVTAAITSAQNIYTALERAGLRVKDLVLQPLASSYSVLQPDEIDLGVCLLDIGGGTTDLAIFYDGAIRYSEVIPLGGEYITNDIAIGLRTPYKQAEETKRKYASISLSPEEGKEEIKVPGIGGREDREITKELLASIVTPRAEEILMITNKAIKRSGFFDILAAGVVITGGTARLRGIDTLAEDIFHLPVKIGIPKQIAGLTDIVQDPIYATGVGLILYGFEKKNQILIRRGKGVGVFDALKKRFEDWFAKYF
ncbi:cell division protein FtsA [candidate division WOR_3 bacterium SM1_77]|jgi:cell division protein FtsA|uniref:Cell division protein FtsA n=1 Tax=candidate division WOR_3 bacterium SM1_77 TaxID=1703778 RepID=A0A0S8JXJ9_UNCW3|nr:MAG: cell division protein FtsA [candidate division WOR_3 bacterium SM1_77]